jgi:hypothetical protein
MQRAGVTDVDRIAARAGVQPALSASIRRGQTRVSLQRRPVDRPSEEHRALGGVRCWSAGGPSEPDIRWLRLLCGMPPSAAGERQRSASLQLIRRGGHRQGSHKLVDLRRHYCQHLYRLVTHCGEGMCHSCRDDEVFAGVQRLPAPPEKDLKLAAEHAEALTHRFADSSASPVSACAKRSGAACRAGTNASKSPAAAHRVTAGAGAAAPSSGILASRTPPGRAGPPPGSHASQPGRARAARTPSQPWPLPSGVSSWVVGVCWCSAPSTPSGARSRPRHVPATSVTTISAGLLLRHPVAVS